MNKMELNTELNMLKAQMQILKQHIGNYEVVSNEIIEATTKEQVKSLMAKREWNIIGFVIDIIMGIIFVYGGAKSLFSYTFTIVTVLWCLFWAIVNVIQYKDNLRDQLLNATIINAVENIILLKRRNYQLGIGTAVTTLVWIGFLLHEIGKELFINPSACIVTGFIYIVVISSVATRFWRINQTTKQMLKQIEQLKEVHKEES